MGLAGKTRVIVYYIATRLLFPNTDSKKVEGPKVPLRSPHVGTLSSSKKIALPPTTDKDSAYQEMIKHPGNAI